MLLRYAIPVVDRRGSGLGNELILWAKAFIAGQTLGMHTLHPAWGINRREYWRYFPYHRSDYFIHRLLRLSIPSIKFEEADYLEYGGGDYSEALLRFALDRDVLNRKPFALEISGLWGGPGTLVGAREFIRAQLLTARYSYSNLYKITQMIGDRLCIGVHIRRGDFTKSAAEGYSGKFNVTIPLSWYESILEQITIKCGGDVVFLVASDATVEELTPITSKFNCISTVGLPNADVSDLLSLASSDFLICSISSFSLWAAFLGKMPYVWLGDQLTRRGEMESIWGHLPAQQPKESLINQSIAAHSSLPQTDFLPRGLGLPLGAVLPDSVIEELKCAQYRKLGSTDLIRYGVTRTR